MKFNKINGWSYKSEDNKVMFANAGQRYWFAAIIDQEESEKFGWIIPIENTKSYGNSIKDAKELAIYLHSTLEAK